MTEVLSVSGLEAGYGSGLAVHGVSLSVAEGQCLVILGANGAGKSTLLKAIMGMVPPRQGVVRLAGEEVQGLRPDMLSRRGLAIVPEGRRIFPVSVRDNLEAARLTSGASPAEVDRVIELFPILGERLRTPALGMSGGEQQMLSIGRALLTQPRVLLLDEPSMGLAPMVVTTVMESVRTVVESGTAVLMVEQNFEATRLLADGVHIMSDGVAGPRVATDDPRVDRFIHEGYFGISEAGPSTQRGEKA